MRYLIFFLYVLFIGGCTSNVAQVANETVVVTTPVFEEYYESEEAFGYLAEVFHLNNAFSVEETYRLLSAEWGIKNEFAYLKSITTITGAVPYYEYIAAYNRLKRNVLTMQLILDDHIDLYTLPDRIIYTATKQKINFIIRKIHITIAATQDNINSKGTADFIGQLTQLYGAVRPLLSTAASLAL